MRKTSQSLSLSRILSPSPGRSVGRRGSSGNWRYNEQTIKANVPARNNDENEKDSVERERDRAKNTHKQKPIRCSEDSEGQRWQLQLFVSCRCCDSSTVACGDWGELGHVLFPLCTLLARAKESSSSSTKKYPKYNYDNDNHRSLC